MLALQKLQFCQNISANSSSFHVEHFIIKYKINNSLCDVYGLSYNKLSQREVVKYFTGCGQIGCDFLQGEISAKIKLITSVFLPWEIREGEGTLKNSRRRFFNAFSISFEIFSEPFVKRPFIPKASAFLTFISMSSMKRHSPGMSEYLSIRIS